MNFKILLVGLNNVGKGSLIHMWKTNQYNNIGPISTYLNCKTNYGIIRLQITQSHTYESNHDANIIMYDLTRPITMEILNRIPIDHKVQVIIGNKCDLLNYNRSRPRIYPYFDISVYLRYNINIVLLYLLRRLVADDLVLY